MTPSPCVKRECSAVGKTQRALWSWLIRRRRWSHAVSRRSSSATSSPGRPAADDSEAVSRLVSSIYPWIGSLIRLTAAKGCRLMDGSGDPDAFLGTPYANDSTPIRGSYTDRIRATGRSIGKGQGCPRPVVTEQDPRPEVDPVLDVVVAQAGGMGL